MTSDVGASARRTCVVTGANGGLGFCVAEGLAAEGHRVIMLCRDAGRGEQARTRVAAATGNPDVELALADLSSLRDVYLAARQIADTCAAVHALVNNAGAVFERRALSADGFEMHWATNFLGAFGLTRWLAGTLADDGRVINLTSMTRRFAPLGPPPAGGGYRLFRAYGRSKRAMQAFSGELAERLRPTGGQAWAYDPGLVRTGIGARLTGARARGWSLIERLAVEPAAAAAPIVELCTAAAPGHPSGTTVVRGRRTVAHPIERGPETARLWASSEAAIEAAVAPLVGRSGR